MTTELQRSEDCELSSAKEVSIARTFAIIPDELQPFFEPAQSAYTAGDWYIKGPARSPEIMRQERHNEKFCQNCGMLVVYAYGGHPFVTSLGLLTNNGFNMNIISNLLIRAGFERADVPVPHCLDCSQFAKKMWPEAYSS